MGFADDENVEGFTMLVDEDTALSGGNVFPFPHEFHPSLTEAMLGVLDADVLVTMRPYTGDSLKAVLRKRCWGVGICNCTEHKKLIIENLQQYAKHMHMADVKAAPKEKQLRS